MLRPWHPPKLFRGLKAHLPAYQPLWVGEKFKPPSNWHILFQYQLTVDHNTDILQITFILLFIVAIITFSTHLHLTDLTLKTPPRKKKKKKKVDVINHSTNTGGRWHWAELTFPRGFFFVLIFSSTLTLRLVQQNPLTHFPFDDRLQVRWFLFHQGGEAPEGSSCPFTLPWLFLRLGMLVGEGLRGVMALGGNLCGWFRAYSWWNR